MILGTESTQETEFTLVGEGLGTLL